MQKLETTTQIISSVENSAKVLGGQVLYKREVDSIKFYIEKRAGIVSTKKSATNNFRKSIDKAESTSLVSRKFSKTNYKIYSESFKQARKELCRNVFSDNWQISWQETKETEVTLTCRRNDLQATVKRSGTRTAISLRLGANGIVDNRKWKALLTEHNAQVETRLLNIKGKEALWLFPALRGGAISVFLSYNLSQQEVGEEIESFFHSEYPDVKIWNVNSRTYIPNLGDRREYQQNIRNADLVVLIVDSEYLKSESAMYEVVQLMQEKGYQNRILPILCEDVNIEDSQYIKYWEVQYKEADEKYTDWVNRKSGASVFSFEKLVEVNRIFKRIEKFMQKIRYAQKIHMAKKIKDEDLAYIKKIVERTSNETLNAVRSTVTSSENSSRDTRIKIFVSYKREEQISVDTLKTLKQEVKKKIDFNEIKFLIKRNYGQTWKEFAQSIMRADLVLLIVTDSYLKDERCMYEMIQLRQSKDYKKKMFIVRAEQLEPSEQYYKHWKEATEQANSAIKEGKISSELTTAYLMKDLKDNIREINSIYGDVTTREWPTLEKVEISGFPLFTNSLHEKIELRKRRAKLSTAMPVIVNFRPPISTFTGRERLLRQMEENLKLTEEEKKVHRTKVVVLSGLGGVGKTELAVKFISENLDNYTMIWTFNAESSVTLQEGYRELAQNLQLAKKEESLSDEEILVRVNRWVEAPKNHGWLLLFDNADFLEIMLQQNLPKFGGQVLITSRKKNTWMTSIEVLEFEREESIHLLRQLIPEHGRDSDSLARLAEALGDLPLALDQAGNFIRNDVTGLTAKEYLQFFQTERLAIWEEEEQEAKDSFYPKTIATTWDITMAYIKKEFPNSAKILNLCAYLNTNGIPLKWLEDWWKEKTPSKGFQLRQELNNLIKPLIDFSLFYWEKPQVLLRIHRLVQLVTQDHISENERGEFIKEALDLVKRQFDAYEDQKPETWRIAQECLSHAINVTNHLSEHYPNLPEVVSSEMDTLKKTASLFGQMGAYAFSQGNVVQAQEYHTCALEMKKAFFGVHHPSVADTLNNLGIVWSDLGEKKKAIEFYEQALEMKNAFLGESHPSVADTLNNLGAAWSASGEKKKAIEFYEQALEMKKAFLGESHPSVADTLNNLGAAWSDLGEKKQAIEFYEQALEMKKAFFGVHHPSVADTLNNLGTAWSDLGEKKQAIEFYEQALAMKKVFLGTHHPSVADTLHNLGAVWSDLGENKKAIEFYEQALEMKKAFFGESHPSVADTLHNLGIAWSDLGKKKKAIAYYEQALEMKKAFFGESHPSVADTLNNLGLVWISLGENKEAIEYCEQALEMKKSFLGESHPSVADTLNNLGLAWSDLGKNKKAIEFYEKALEMKKAFLGESHPSVADTLNNLGLAWSDLGKNKKAIEFYEKALEMKKAFLGESHPSVADTLNNLGLAWSDLGKNKKAIEFYEKALEMKKAFLGESHPSVADTLNNLGLAWSDLGENKKATEYFTQAHAIFQECYGDNHPHTQGVQANLNRNLLEINSTDQSTNRSIEALLQAFNNTHLTQESNTTPDIDDLFFKASTQEDQSARQKLQELAAQNDPKALQGLQLLKESTEPIPKKTSPTPSQSLLTAKDLRKASIQGDPPAYQELQNRVAQNDPEAKNELLFLKGYFKQKKQFLPAP